MNQTAFQNSDGITRGTGPQTQVGYKNTVTN